METRNKFKKGDKIKAVRDLGDLSLILNKIYEVESVETDGFILVKNDIGNFEEYKCHRFELVESSLPSIEEQIKLAKSFIGKRVASGTIDDIASEIFVHVKSPNTSYDVKDFYRIHGYCVAVRYGCCESPVVNLKLLPEFKELKLNDNHTAKIFKDRVEVGCQTFPIKVIRELAKLVN